MSELARIKESTSLIAKLTALKSIDKAFYVGDRKEKSKKGIHVVAETITGRKFTANVRCTTYSAENIFIKKETPTQKADFLFEIDADFVIAKFSNCTLVFETDKLTERLKEIEPQSMTIVGYGSNGPCVGYLGKVHRLLDLAIKSDKDFLEAINRKISNVVRFKPKGLAGLD